MFTGLRSSSVMLLAVSLPAAAQWLNYPTPGIPRLPDCKPNLAAPAPRRADGKPDLSGIWEGFRRNAKYVANLANDLKPGEFPIQPWAEALSEARTRGGSVTPFTRCLPPGVAEFDLHRFKIIQEPNLVVILSEVLGGFRQIFLDGRALPR